MRKSFKEACAKTRANILKLCVIWCTFSLCLIGVGQSFQKPKSMKTGIIGLETGIPVGVITAICPTLFNRKKKKDR